MSSPGPTLLAAARVLELSGEPLDPEQLAALARLISRPASRLRSLALRACSLDDAALARLAPALASAPALATLDLGDNPLTCESAARLAAIVRAHPALTRLEADGTAIRGARRRGADRRAPRRAARAAGPAARAAARARASQGRAAVRQPKPRRGQQGRARAPRPRGFTARAGADAPRRG
ncbi:MAG: hypothetical protein H6713_03510 [Myxococcales bacterium]|nr:hypothetical protein [Myxococcales bacterium]